MIVLFLVLGFFVFASSVFATPKVSITYLPSEIKVGEAFTLTASISGLATSSGYYTKVRLGNSSSAMSKAQTFNVTRDAANAWLSDNDSWVNFPTITPDSTGSWTGMIMARPSSSVVVGQNHVVIRIRSSEKTTNYDSESAMTNISMGQSTVETTTASPEISWQLPAAGVLGQDFKVNLNLKNFPGDTQYYLKIRSGPDEKHLTKILTKNNGNYYSDNDAWSNFPVIKTDASGNWAGDLWGMCDLDKTEGLYKTLIRIKSQEKNDYIESNIQEINFIKPAEIITASVEEEPEVEIVSASVPAKIFFEEVVLGTESATSVAALTIPDSVPEPETQSFNWLVPVLASSGLVLILVALGIFAYKKYGFGIIRVLSKTGR